MEAIAPPSIASEEIDIRITRIFKREDGIICVEAKDNVDITLKDSFENSSVVQTLSNQKKVPVLSHRISGAITDEVHDDWFLKKKADLRLAEAVVAKSLAHKLIAKT